MQINRNVAAAAFFNDAEQLQKADRKLAEFGRTPYEIVHAILDDSKWPEQDHDDEYEMIMLRNALAGSAFMWCIDSDIDSKSELGINLLKVVRRNVERFPDFSVPLLSLLLKTAYAEGVSLTPSVMPPSPPATFTTTEG
jgi:hypothetical protein